MTLSPSRNTISPCSFSRFDLSGGLRYCWRIPFSRSTPRRPFRIGVSTWMSYGVASTNFGSFCFTNWSTTLMMISASYRFRKKKSMLLLSRETSSPRLILCAFTMMSLVDAWRKIFVSITTLNASDWMMSFNTLPGPTLGSWLISPTRISLVPGAIAFKREFISVMSTIDISSIITRSVSNGFVSLRSNPALPSIPPFNSSMRWIVRASNPVVSLILFAARPVGAARKMSMPSISKYRMIVLIVVVLPVPGPPVMTKRPFRTASFTACTWCSSNCIPVCFSMLWIRCSISASATS